MQVHVYHGRVGAADYPTSTGKGSLMQHTRSAREKMSKLDAACTTKTYPVTYTAVMTAVVYLWIILQRKPDPLPAVFLLVIVIMLYNAHFVLLSSPCLRACFPGSDC